MSTQARNVFRYLVLTVTIVAGLGPTIAQLSGLVPATWLAVASHVVSVAGAVHLMLQDSPLLQPLLPISQSIPPPKMPRIPPTIGAMLATLSLSGCALFASKGAAIATSVGDVAACVISHAENDKDPTFETIAAECSGVAVSDVVTIVTALAAAPDGGAAEATVLRYRAIHHSVTR
jgi:hypothetical protein